METLNVVYDFECNPASYDFILFLAEAEKFRLSEGKYDGMNVHFMPGIKTKFYTDYYPKDDKDREGLLWRVCVPACRLVKSVRGVFVHAKRENPELPKYPESWEINRPTFSHGAHLFLNAPRCFSASPQAKAWVAKHTQRGYFTITLRECEYGLDRNSKRDQWQDLADYIQLSGRQVHIIPDTYGDGFKGKDNCIQAAWDIDIRLALYEGAALNMGVANGPMSLCVLSESHFVVINSEGMGKHDTEWGKFKNNIDAHDLSAIIDTYLKKAA